MSDRDAEPGRPGTDWRHARTERLWLDRPGDADIDDLHAIHGDPRTWTHLPSGVHPDRTFTEVKVDSWLAWWDHDRLGFWSARDRAGGPVVGCGGCTTGEGWPWWNLYYRFAPAVQGRGYAVEMGRAAIGAARDLAPDRPVIAFLLEHNLASRRTAEKLGMQRVWSGPDDGNPDPDAVRLVFCDRDPSAELLSDLGERFRRS